MKMKKLLVVTAVSATFFVPLSAHADDLLTGDARLACEAILCLFVLVQRRTSERMRGIFAPLFFHQTEKAI